MKVEIRIKMKISSHSPPPAALETTTYQQHHHLTLKINMFMEYFHDEV